MRIHSYSCGQGLIGIIVVLVIVGLITGALYLYFSNQIPEVSEVTEKPIEETIKPEEEISTTPEEKIEEEKQELTSPKIYLSSDKLEQGDTLLIKINNESFTDKISGEFGLAKIGFFKLPTLESWIGILGIDAKEKPEKYNLVINFSDDQKIKKEIVIIERKFLVTELLVTKELEEKGFTLSKIGENVSKENLIIGKVLSLYTPKAYFNKAFTNPSKEIEVVGAFGNIRKSGNVGIQHLGVDLKLDIGTPIYAINDGVVGFSQELATYGKTIIIDHGLGIFSLYLHLNEFKVSTGEEVKRGDIIALSGNTGYSIEPHLHFSVRVSGSSVDPLRFIGTIEKEMIK